MIESLTQLKEVEINLYLRFNFDSDVDEFKFVNDGLIRLNHLIMEKKIIKD